MSDSQKSRHHHHHESYQGPRSTHADGLSSEYMQTLSEESDRPTGTADSRLTENIDDLNQELAADIRSSISMKQDIWSEEEALRTGLEYENKGTAETAAESRTKQKTAGRKQHSGKKKKKKMDSWTRGQRRRRTAIRILIVIAALLLFMICSLLYLRYRGEQNLKKNVVEKPVEVTLPEQAEKDDDANLIIYNGERYWYNEDIITVLCLGVDREQFATADDMVIGGNGQADADVLLVFDKKQGKVSILNISRDSMVDLDRYNDKGQFIDTVKEQLCLSYAFGNGQETSCENTALSVSRLLYGTPINAYAAIDFDSIGTLNDAIGGVSVPVTEDIADKFPDAPVGSLVTLVGSEAVTYVRHRDTALLDSNNSRMSRQKQYLTAYLRKVLEQIKADPTRTVSLFNSVSDNMVTSIELSEVTYFGSFFAEHGFNTDNLYSVQGEVIEGEDGYAQFIPDETQLLETVLQLFYIKE